MRRLAALLLFAAALLAQAPKASALEIALTFDDLPTHGPLAPNETRVGVASRIVAALSEAGAPSSYGFINGRWLEDDNEGAAVLNIWRAAGHPLANHTWSHMRLTDATAASFKSDVARNEPLLQALMAGQDWRWFRYPYLAEGESGATREDVGAFLRARRYKIADVTMNFSDYAWNGPYVRCAEAADAAAIAGLERAYLSSAKAELDSARDRARAQLGREIPFVLLLHSGTFTARMLPQLLALYKQNGARLVTLPEAQRDPFYSGASRLEPLKIGRTGEGVPKGVEAACL